MAKDYCFAAWKISLGMRTLSFFLCMGGLYSVFVGIAKHAYFHGRKRGAESKDAALPHYRVMASSLLVGATAYIIYMGRLFSHPERMACGTIPAIALATVSFMEFGLAMRGLVLAKRRADLLGEGLTRVNLSSALTSIVLTQAALLSLSGSGDFSLYNATAGTLFGGICALIALRMLIAARRGH